MKYIYYVLPLLSGITITTQAGVNSQLRFAVQNPWVAAFISFLVGTLVLGLVIIVTKQQTPSLATLQSVALYKYAGGLLGAFFVTAIIYSVPHVGAANVFALVVTGQFLCALLYDSIGMFGLPQVPFSWIKLLGVAMLIGGAYLIVKK
jgi:transporter family-2 protein